MLDVRCIKFLCLCSLFEISNTNSLYRQKIANKKREIMYIDETALPSVDNV